MSAKFFRTHFPDIFRTRTREVQFRYKKLPTLLSMHSAAIFWYLSYSLVYILPILKGRGGREKEGEEGQIIYFFFLQFLFFQYFSKFVFCPSLPFLPVVMKDGAQKIFDGMGSLTLSIFVLRFCAVWSPILECFLSFRAAMFLVSFIIICNSSGFKTIPFSFSFSSPFS